MRERKKKIRKVSVPSTNDFKGLSFDKFKRRVLELYVLPLWDVILIVNKKKEFISLLFTRVLSDLIPQ